MLRFPVEDTDRLASYFEEMDIPLEYAPVETTLAPYGAVRMLALRAPDGAWIEFFETLAPSSAE